MKATTIMLAAAAISIAATEAEKKARGIVFEYNAIAQQGSTYEKQTMCYYQKGIYFTYGGQDYVIDVEPLRCRYENIIGNTGETICLTYKGTSKSKRLCDCTPNGELQCQK